MTNTKPKPRTGVVNLHIEQGDSIEGFFSKERQEMTFHVLRQNKKISARKVEYTKFYMRDSNKPKFLNKIEFQKSSDFTLSHLEALKKFNLIWAIDTNKKEIWGEVANVSVITEGDTSGSGDFRSTLAMIFGLTAENPELYAWRKFICLVMDNLENSSSMNFGLIVDSELDKISKFNDRELPIHGGYFLPENWRLIYATSDSGKESIFNRMLAESDKNSTKTMNWMAQLEKNVKHWQPIVNEEEHQPTILPLINIKPEPI